MAGDDESAARFRSLLEQSPVAISVAGAGFDRYANPAFLRLFGFASLEEFRRWPMEELVAPEYRRAMAERMRRRAAGEQVDTDMEIVAVRRDGSRFDDQLKVRSVQMPEGPGSLAFHEDITDRKRTLEALRQSEERYRAVLEQSPVPIAVHRAGRGLFANQAHLRLFGYQRLGDMPVLTELVAPEGRAEVGERVRRRALGLPAETEFEFVGLRRDGTRFPALAKTAPVELADGPATLVFHTDLTEVRRATEGLRASEARNRAVVETLREGVLVQRPDGTIDACNSAAERILRLPRAVLRGRAIAGADWQAYREDGSVFPPEAFPFRQALATGQPVPGTIMRLVRPGGETVWLEVASAPLTLGPGGQVEALVTTLVDLTAARQARTALAEFEALLATVFESTADLIWSVDAERFGLLTFNRAMSDAFLSARGQRPARGDRPQDLFAEGDVAGRWSALYRRALQEGAFQTDYLVPAGSRMLELKLWPLRQGGTTFGISVFGRDVTEQREAAEQLRRREAFFHAVLQGSPDFAAVIGADRRYRYVSAGATNVLGWTEEELKAFGAGGELIHPDDLPRVNEDFRELITRPGQVVRTSYRSRHKDGSWRLMEALGRNLLDDPDVQGVVVNARDATEQRRLEEQVQQGQRLESLGRLAGGVAHDFNNILTVILSAAEELGEAAARGRPSSVEDVQEIAAAARRARDITQQLLAFARRQAVAPVALDLNEAIRTSEKMLRRLLGEDVELTLALGEGLWPVRFDPGQVDQILLNLVANARFALPGGGHVTIGTANVERREPAPSADEAAPGAWVRLVVRDDGVGMTPEVKARLFEPFFTTRELGQGTGLGLATVHGIVAQAGGHIRVESEPDGGTEIEILLPRAAGVEVVASPGSAGPTDVRGDERILLVEDDPSVRGQALRALLGAGYRVEVAADGVQAVELARSLDRQPDLLLTDVVMPRLDGRRLAELLRAQWPGLRVLFTSGYAEDRLATGGEPIPGADLLPKPFTGPSLLARVRTALDRGR